MIQNSFIILLHFPGKRPEGEKQNNKLEWAFTNFTNYIPLGFPIIHGVRGFTIYFF